MFHQCIDERAHRELEGIFQSEQHIELGDVDAGQANSGRDLKAILLGHGLGSRSEFKRNLGDGFERARAFSRFAISFLFLPLLLVLLQLVCIDVESAKQVVSIHCISKLFL